MAIVTAPAASIIRLDECTYTACYCEENVYLLVKQLQQQQPNSKVFAVFISNSNETVIALQVPDQSAAGAALVWDLDLKHPHLQFPCTLREYAQHALQADAVELPGDFQRMYRLVPAASLLQHFASDRSHMRQPDGSWCAEPPQYPCITAADGCRMNLHRYRDMSCDVLQHTPQHSITGAMHSAAAGTMGTINAAASASVATNSLSAGDEPARCHACHAASGVPQEHQGTPATAGLGTAATPLLNTVPASSSQLHAGVSEQPAAGPVEAVAAGGLGTDGPVAALDGGGMLISWQHIVYAAHKCKYGVVVQEDTLLRCLLG